jgi:hypothetical protein
MAGRLAVALHNHFHECGWLLAATAGEDACKHELRARFGLQPET